MHTQLQPLVKIQQHNIALLFSNYLNSQGIEAVVESETDGFVVLLSASTARTSQANLLKNLSVSLIIPNISKRPGIMVMLVR